MTRVAIVFSVFAISAAALDAGQAGPTPARGRGATPSTQVAAAKPLDIYVVDPEGGKAALWITPSGATVLIDSGNPGARDLDRIMEVVTAAGVTKLDYLISTHYHVDHIGGMQELVKRIPVTTFVDHGPTVEGPVVAGAREQVAGFWQTIYPELYSKAKRMVVKPGDTLPLAGVDWRIVTSAAQVLKTPMAGAPGAGQPNPACADTPPKPVTGDDDNGQSVGSVVTLGQFRAADFGDLLWEVERNLMCPSNPIGTIDLFMVTHHGLPVSNAPALVYGLAPRVAVMQNGTTKGAAVEVMQTLRSSPRLEDIWQLHWSYTAGIEHNAPGVFIANLEDPATLGARLTAPARGGGGGGTPAAPPAAGAQPQAGAQTGGAGGRQAEPATGGTAPGAQTGGGGGRGGGAAAAHSPAYWIKISARADGSFTVTNSRNNFSKTYPARGAAASGRGR